MENFEINRINPGILVSEQCSLRGGIQYIRNYTDSEISEERLTKTYEAKVIVRNVKERKEGNRVRSWARYNLRKLCAETSVGLICPLHRADALNEVIKKVRAEINKFNNESQTCSIVARYAFYHVEETNAGAIAAISDQLVSIADRVKAAITDNEAKIINNMPRRNTKGLSREEIFFLPTDEKEALVATARADMIRAAVLDAKCLDDIVVFETKDKVDELIQASKKIAKKLKKDVVKHHRSLETVLEGTDLNGVNSLRSMFFSAAMIADDESVNEIERMMG